MILAIDLSLRSTGVVILNDLGILEDFRIVANKEKDEELVIKNSKDILEFVKGRWIEHVAIEGLSFMSVSASKDLIAGNFWFLRCQFIDRC